MQFKIVLICTKCGNEFTVGNTFYESVLGELILEVEPCGCKSTDGKGRVDCTDCEDIEMYKSRLKDKDVTIGLLRKKIETQRAYIVEVETKLAKWEAYG